MLHFSPLAFSLPKTGCIHDVSSAFVKQLSIVFASLNFVTNSSIVICQDFFDVLSLLIALSMFIVSTSVMILSAVVSVGWSILNSYVSSVFSCPLHSVLVKMSVPTLNRLLMLRCS